MFRILSVLLIVFINQFLIESVIIEHPSNKYIEERQRKDLDIIDPIFRYYIIPYEIQFHINAIKDDLPYFLRCKGTKKSVQFTIPSSANNHLSLNRDDKTHTITAKLLKNQLTSNLIGRYTCSENINDKIHETTVYVFIQNERSIFTHKAYPKIFKQTGVHFFNIPCQTTNWYSKMSCSISSNTKHEQDSFFFDPQIGFALENPIISDRINQFTCMSNRTLREESNIPYDKSQPGFVEIHQRAFTVTNDEIVQLSCEIRYEKKAYQKEPQIFWFEDIYNLKLISNETEPRIFNDQTNLYHQNSTLIVQGLKPGETYRFYCVRASDHRLYSRSIDITCSKSPSLDVEINPSKTNTNNEIQYGSNGVYDIRVITVPRSEIQIDVLCNGIALSNERIQLSIVNNEVGRLWDYTLTIYNMTFEDETDFNIIAKSSILEKSITIKPKIIGNPVGQLSFIHEQIPRLIPWRNENNSKIYLYGIDQHESYRIVCNVRHRSDQKRSLNILIQYYQCSIDNCLSNILDKTCRLSSSSSQNSITTTSHRTNKFQTQFISTNSYKINDPTIGHQYLCCYEQNGLINIDKAITILSHNRSMFMITKPEYGLVTGDILTYRCEGHQLIYDNLQMIYNDGFFTYERNHLDKAWHLKGTQQGQQIDIAWNVPINKNIRSIAIEVKTPALTKSRNNGYFQCIARSKRVDIISNAVDKYVIHVEDSIPLEFKRLSDKVSRINRKAGDYIELDCTFDGRPKPKIIWLRGKLHINISQTTFQFENDKGSLRTNRAQAIDTGYYTCLLDNGRGKVLERNFHVHVEGSNPYSKFNRLTAPVVIISILLLIIMLIVLIIFGIRYCKMTKTVYEGFYHDKKAVGEEDETQPALSQLARIPLPDNFASQHQIHTFLNYVNGKTVPTVPDDFKELGHGQFGVVYQVRLPDVGLVAAKILPETIRRTKYQRDKRKKSDASEESQEMISKHEVQKRKAVDMLIDEIKVMHKAGKHVNIVALKKVAYPEAKFRLLFTGGPISDEDSFYLMELCSNGSLDSMLKCFIKPPLNTSKDKLSLYETLSKRLKSEMTVTEAYEQCLLTDDDLKLIAYQVACGIDYLNRRQIAHCDLAARNVLVTSRFIMKICDFGLATWTTYKNYREQLEQNESVQLEKKNNEIATHNLTPELARAFLRASNPNEQLLINKSTIKSDVWSFGIFLWTLFLKCRIRPFSKLLDEMQRTSTGKDFFHQLARMIGDGRVLRYIDYHSEIPRNIYAIIRDCLVEENARPEMTRIRAYLCHSNMLSKQAFEYYRSEYNSYQEENATDGNVERLAEDQGVSDLPSFEDEYSIYAKPQHHDDIKYRPRINDELYYTEPDGETYLPPTKANSSRTTTTEYNRPQIQIKKPTLQKPNDDDDSYL